MGEREDQNRYEVGQISQETGVSGDYINEFQLIAWMKAGVSTYEEWIQYQRDKSNIILKYRERYPENEFINVVTEKNRANIEELDQIVDKLNEIVKNPDSANKEAVIALSDKARILVYGK